MGNGRVYKRENRFTQVSNSVLRDETLSFKAKGLYAVINSYLTIPNFTLYKSFLQAHCMEGKKAFENAWKEIKNSGYFVQHKIKDPKTGNFYYEYELLDEKKPPQETLKNKGLKAEIQTPLLEGVDKVDVRKVGYGAGGSINNTNCTKTDLSKTGEITHTTATPEKTDFREEKTKNVVCVNNALTLQEEIKRVTGHKVPIKKIQDLLTSSTVERIQYHLNNWDIHKEHQKVEGAGWFITVIENDITPEKRRTGGTGKENGNGKRAFDNFEERAYTKEQCAKWEWAFMDDEPSEPEQKKYTYVEDEKVKN